VSNVVVVTDTISCLPPELVREYSILIIPVGLIIDRKSYLDTRLSNEEFWQLFERAKEPITTAAVNPAEFETFFTRLAEETDSICCILVSGQLSSTCNAAISAKETLEKKFPALKIEVLDSKTATGAEGFIVLEAARAAHSGQDLNAVTAAAREMIPRVKFVTVMSTLKYLIRSGRAPKAALIGDWLKVKPLIGMVSGSGLVDSLGKERGMDKALQKILDLIEEHTDTGKPLHVMVHYTNDKAQGEKLKEMLLSRYSCSEVYLTPYTPVMASQTGPVLAIAFYS
jgi:DegV family protein with EDD domain